MKFLLSLILVIFITSCARSRHVESNENKRQQLLARINLHGDINNPTTPRPLVTLEEFFEGNDSYASIGYNFYPDQPAPSEFYSLFLEIRSKPMVSDVRVQVNDLEEPTDWPSTDTVWIITSANPNEVKSWLGDRFQPDDLFIGFPEFYNFEPYDIPQGQQAIGVWWD